ncbi:MAG: hypothetical protein LH468_08320 [Nocardioides sp.]|nr:hypothetical protein [Nocardioides sp.]
MSSFSVRVSLAACAVVLATSSACSVAGTDFQPGVAARVGDQTVTSNEVDRLTVAACGAFGPQLEAQNQVVALRQIKATVVQDLTLESAVRQLGEEYGVEPGETYLSEVSSAGGGDDLSDDEREAVVVVSSTTTLVTDVLGQIGAQLTAGGAGEDVAGAPAAATPEAVQRGGAELTRWLQDNDVEVDPQYGIDISDTGAVEVDTSLAFGVSDVAKAAGAEQPDPATTMALPQTQRCGSYTAGGGQG